MRRSRLPSPLLFLLLLLPCLVTSRSAPADTVVFKNGRSIEDVVVSRNDAEFVVINPWNSRLPGMTWEIPEKNRYPREKIKEIIFSDPPLIELRRREITPGLGADDHWALARFCKEHRFDKERKSHLVQALSLDPHHVAALEAFGGEARWTNFARGNPTADPDLRRMEHEYLSLEDPADLKEKFEAMRASGSRRAPTYLERARRSARQPKGLRQKVALTLGSEEAVGATYCIYVPRRYDPLVPTPLVIGLHGGGRGGKDATIVTGSGEQAMPFYQQEAEKWGWIVVCPTALAAPWSARKNEPWIDALVEEMCTLYNIDASRIYLTGHSMGGFGTWHWGPLRAEIWAAISPCAGGGSVGGVKGKGLPIYIYHGSDDHIVGPSSDRAAARSLGGARKPYDFVYTELDGVGHGFPSAVRADIFRFFAGRRKDKGKRRVVEPVSSFDRKVTKVEKVAFGDPKKLPTTLGGGDDLKDLIDALERGGGGAEDAARALGARKDGKTVRAVARVLRSRRSSEDVKVHAAAALGALGSPDCIKSLVAALKDEDYRVVVAATTALGATGLPEAAAGVARGMARLGEIFEKSIQGGSIPFRAYEVRLAGLEAAAKAAARIAKPRVLLPALEAEVVARVFGRGEPLQVLGENDPRFKRNPSEARLRLGRALIGAAQAWGDPAAFELLARVRDAWQERQPDLASLMVRALKKQALKKQALKKQERVPAR